MSTLLTIMAVHITTTALGGLYVYRQGVTLPRIVALALWAVLFFPVAYNVMKFI